MNSLHPDSRILHVSNDARCQSNDALRWRCIGPPRGGRVVAVAGHPSEPMTFYFGACAGGVWKTVDGGTYWENVSDGFFNTASIGALTVSESDPNVIYAGTGETTIRLDVSYGDGVYRSVDGGKTWAHLGLEETRHIGEIRVHPHNPDLVYVAALGHAFGPNPERGVYRSKDGGENWEKVLFRSDKAGAVDLTMDPNNPRILFASIWETHRNFWELSSGGPDSSLYRSTDGGDTWEDITDNQGMPNGIKGKIGISISPAKSDRVWAIVESEKGGVYQSEDGGDTWEQLTSNHALWERPWYYCHIFADSQDSETVYITNLSMWKSTDGGKTFNDITTPHGDNHDLWIDPNDPKRMILGNDGGACVSFNGGESWSTIYNQLTSQFYRIAVDNQFPYRVYATQQDNSSISVPSATEYGGIRWNDCYPAGTGESGDITVRPDDPNIVYIGAVGSSPGGGGPLQRYDHRTRHVRLITVWPEGYFGWGPKDLKYRFSWTFPISLSPHDPNVLYAAGNLVFRSTDEGNSWEAISPDLTRNDESKLGPSGGPITLDCSGAEHYGTVYAFAESPHEPGVFWAGSDDGIVHISKNDGESWEDITPASLPEWSLIHKIEPSIHDRGTAYIAATRYKLDDYQPYLYKSEDYGETWRTVSDNLPDGEITRVIRQDPIRKHLLYVGTETGVFVSFDDGENWGRLQSNLPVVPVYDMAVKDNELVLATHGRSFWILDDLTPLRQLTEEVTQSSVHLFEPPATYRRYLQWSARGFRSETGKNYMAGLGAAATFYEEKLPQGGRSRRYLDAGEGPPNGVVIHYLLEDTPTEEVTLTIFDSKGEEISTFASIGEECSDTKEDGDTDCEPLDSGAKRLLSTDQGLNRYVWDMRYPDATEVTENPSEEPGNPLDKESSGPLAPPGAYQAQLKVNGRTYTQSFELLKDPRMSAPQSDFEDQFKLWCDIRDKISETHEGINLLRRIRGQVEEWKRRAKGANNAECAKISEASDALLEKLKAIEIELIQTEPEAETGRLRMPVRLNTKLGDLTSVVSCVDAAPPKQAYDVFEHLSGMVDEQLSKLQSLIEADVAEFNAVVNAANLPAVGV